MVGQDLGIGYYYCSIYVPIPNSTELRMPYILNIAAVMVYLIRDAALGLLYLPTYSTLLPCVGIHLKLDSVNMDVRPLLFTKLSLFTKSSLDKE